MKKFIFLLTGLLAACSTTIPVNYVPSPSIKGSGSVTTDKFKYTPASKKEVKENQFQTAKASIGSMYLSENVSDLIEKSLRKELIASGFDVDNQSGVKISGSIDKFLYDFVGFTEMDIYLEIHYVVTKDGKDLYQKTVKSHKALPKMPSYDSEAIRSVISENISDLLLELRTKKFI